MSTDVIDKHSKEHLYKAIDAMTFLIENGFTIFGANIASEEMPSLHITPINWDEKYFQGFMRAVSLFGNPVRVSQRPDGHYIECHFDLDGSDLVMLLANSEAAAAYHVW